MVQSLRRLTGVGAIVLGCVLVLAGCGSGGGNGLSSVSGSGTITGAVTASRTQAAPSGTVTVAIDGTNFSTTPASDGTFTLAHVPAGVYTLLATDGAHACPLVVTVKDGGTTDVGDMVMADAGQISGLVTASDTQAPIGRVKITVTPAATTTTTPAPLPVRVMATNGAGSYACAGLPAGSYVVAFTKTGYTAASLTLTVTAGSTTAGDIALTPAAAAATGSMTGSVTALDASGTPSPIGGVLVRLTSPGDVTANAPMPRPYSVHGGFGVPVADMFTFSDATGAYTLSNVPAGTYLAVAVRPGLTTATATVTIAANAALTQNFQLTLPVPHDGIITGTVTDNATGSAIADALVFAEIATPADAGGSGTSIALLPNAVCGPFGIGMVHAGGIEVMSARTNSSGQYKLLVPTLVTGIEVRARGYATQSAPVTVTGGGTVTANVALTAAATPSP